MLGQGRVYSQETRVWDGSASTDVRCDHFHWCTMQFVGTGTGTIQATVDGTNWVTTDMQKLDDQTQVSAPTAAGLYRVRCSGYLLMRVLSPASFTSITARTAA